MYACMDEGFRVEVYRVYMLRLSIFLLSSAL